MPNLLAQAGLSGWRQLDGAAAAVGFDPAAFAQFARQRGAERAGEMITALAPVDAATR